MFYNLNANNKKNNTNIQENIKYLCISKDYYSIFYKANLMISTGLFIVYKIFVVSYSCIIKIVKFMFLHCL